MRLANRQQMLSMPMALDFQSIPLAPGGEGLLGHNSAFRSDRMGLLRSIARTSHPLIRLKMPLKPEV